MTTAAFYRLKSSLSILLLYSYFTIEHSGIIKAFTDTQTMQITKNTKLSRLHHGSLQVVSLHESKMNVMETDTNTANCNHDNHDINHNMHLLNQQRRCFFQKLATACTNGIILSLLSNDNEHLQAFAISPTTATTTNTPDVNTLISQLKEARTQLNPIPTLIQQEKWDSIRAILITPPLADCWAKTSKPLLKQYADIQERLPNGDELTALELREEALDHLRFLDMAVYNNVFNPIKAEGETGATKELIRSYYEDPVKEYEASVKVLDELILLSN